MERRVLVWANNFYGESLGCAPIIDLQDPNNEATILKDYKDCFELPLARMLTNTDILPNDPEKLNNALVKIANGPITDWIYLLKFVVENNMFEYTGNFNSDMDNCFKRIKEEMRVLFATTGCNGKDIALHTYNGRIIDQLPKKLLVYPKGLRAHFGGKLLKDIAAKAPTKTLGVERILLANAVRDGFIPVTDLANESVCVPQGSNSESLVYMDATNVNLPPKDYTDITTALPSSSLVDGKTRIELVLEFSKSNEISDELRSYLAQFDGIVNTTSSEYTGDLTDAMVIEYLAANKGLYVNTLDDLAVSGADLLFGTTSIDADLLAGSAQELIDALSSEDKPAMTTLDALIITYCSENRIDTECTIQQLLDNINCDTNPVPPSINDMLVNTMAEKGIVPETTLDEFIKGVKHVPYDPTDTVLDWIADNPLLTPDIESALRNAILYDKQVEVPSKAVDKNDVLKYIESLDCPTSVYNKLYEALDNPKEAFRAMEVDDVTKETIEEYISESNWTETEKFIVSNAFRDPASFVSLHSKLNGTEPMSVEELLKLVNVAEVPLEAKTNMLQILRNPDKPILQSDAYIELGYKAGEILLKATRKAISKDASWEVREKYTPVLYAFLRLLMCDLPKEREAVKEFLEGKLNEASTEVASLIKEAISLLE